MYGRWAGLSMDVLYAEPTLAGANAYDTTMVRSRLVLLQLARRFRLEQRDQGRAGDGILVTLSSNG